MQSRKLFILVEGYDDKRFFEKIIQPLFQERYFTIAIRTYANKKNEEIVNLVRNIKQTNADYIFVVDKNSERICITAKKIDTQKRYECVDIDKIIVVLKEIESWYLAGLNKADAQQLGLPVLENTENIGKKKFEEYLRNKFNYKTGFKTKDFLTEILKYFSITTAKQKNASFKYFADKYQL